MELLHGSTLADAGSITHVPNGQAGAVIQVWEDTSPSPGSTGASDESVIRK
jgi:hypothetical protein